MGIEKRVWLITGISGGLRRALAKNGGIVIGTLRKEEQNILL